MRMDKPVNVTMQISLTNATLSIRSQIQKCTYCIIFLIKYKTGETNFHCQNQGKALALWRSFNGKGTPVCVNTWSAALLQTCLKNVFTKSEQKWYCGSLDSDMPASFLNPPWHILSLQQTGEEMRTVRSTTVPIKEQSHQEKTRL